MGMFAVSKYLLKERTWRSQDKFVCLHLLAILTCQGHISEILVISQASKSTIGILLEVIPLQTEFFWHHNKRDFPNCSNDLHNYSCFVGKGLCDVDLMKGILQSLEEIQLLLSNFHTLLFHKMHCHNKSCVRQVCFQVRWWTINRMLIRFSFCLWVENFHFAGIRSAVLLSLASPSQMVDDQQNWVWPLHSSRCAIESRNKSLVKSVDPMAHKPIPISGGALLNWSGWVLGPWDLRISPNFYSCFQ